MIILFILFVIQFSIACACLAFNEKQQQDLALEGWSSASVANRNQVQTLFNCCGFDEFDHENGISCVNVACCQVDNCQHCLPCIHPIQKTISNALAASGYIGIFFSFTEVGFFFGKMFTDSSFCYRSLEYG